MREFSEGAFVVMATRLGQIKKTSLDAFGNIRVSGIIALTIADDDDLVSVRITEGASDLLLGTRNGWAIRFREENVRPMGRSARGVRGIRLRKGAGADADEVVGMAVIPREEPATLLTVCEKGYGKRTPTSDYPTKNRGGKGVITIKTTERNGKVVGLRLVTDDDDIMLITDGGKLIRMPVAGIPTIGRNTQGVRLIRLEQAQAETEKEAEKEAENRFNNIIATIVALVATFVALCNVKDGNVVQAMQQAQANAVDTWAYYQSKSTKQNIAEQMADQLTLERDIDGAGLSAEARALYEKKITEYTAKAKQYEAEAAEHADMAKAFRARPTPSETKRPGGADTAAHCESMADSLAKAAKEARAMASMHEELAKK